jgi:hypothetical protein
MPDAARSLVRPGKMPDRRKMGRPRRRQTLPLSNPSTGETIGAIARGGAADIDAAVTAAQGAFEGDWGRMPARWSGAGCCSACASSCWRRSSISPARGDRRRQAAETGAGRCGGAGPLPGVLRRRRRQAAWANDPLSGRLHRLHPARAAWRHRPHRALELSDADHRPLRRRGARHGQRLRAETRRGRLPDGAGLRRPRHGMRACRRARSTWCRAWAAKPARRSPPIPASITSPSPARSRPASKSRRRQRGMSSR